MITIDLTLKNTPFPLSVQRKSAEEAEAIYKKVLEAMRSGSPDFIELTCDRQPEKKVAILTREISGVQISLKDGTSASGRPPGFFALT